MIDPSAAIFKSNNNYNNYKETNKTDSALILLLENFLQSYNCTILQSSSPLYFFFLYSLLYLSLCLSFYLHLTFLHAEML